MGLNWTRKRKQTRGMAMVEMVFVLPLLILIVFMIASFGLMFSRWLTLSNAVREGARTGVAWRGATCATTVPPISQQVKDKVVAYARAGGVPLQTSDVTVTNACGATGTQLDVSASYNFKLNIPYGKLGSVPLAYKSSMRNE